MKFKVDHDLHIHTLLSHCSKDPGQTPERILRYARENGFGTVSVADHLWDTTVPGVDGFYVGQDIAHIEGSRPLPEAEGVRFLFGCETEIRRDLTLGLASENYGRFDFIIIPTTHLHMVPFTIEKDDDRAEALIKRLEAALSYDLPYHKVGLAHITSDLVAGGHGKDPLSVIDRVSDGDFRKIFTRAAGLGCGIELNYCCFRRKDSAERERENRPYRIARACGCRFYCGSDAHHPAVFEDAKSFFSSVTEELGLLEGDKFDIAALGK